MLNLIALNEAQRRAVTYGDGHLLVLAGPGSGKTFTIVQRIFYLLEVCKIPAEQILVVTFTKDAALSMQKRFWDQSESIHPVNFGTFHSIFYHILRETHNFKTAKIATDKEKKAIMKAVLKKYTPNVQNDYQKVTSYLSAISFYKNTGDMKRASEKLSEEDRENFANVLRDFEEARRNSGLLDFDDMVFLCKELLEKDAVAREKWQTRFRYILMDEFQDINPIQYDTVKLLVGPHASLFAVGDDDQAIYGFRGSKPACLKQFKEEFHAESVYLDINYRSRKEIVEASVKVISENKDRFEKKMRTKDGSLPGGKSTLSAVQLRPFENKDSQYEYLTSEIKQELEEMSDNETIAILFRTNAFMQSFAVRLNRLEIPYEMKEAGSSVYEHFVVKDIMAYLTLAENPTDRNALLRILNKPNRDLNREALGFGSSIKDMRNYYPQNSKLDKLEKDMEYLKRMPLFLRLTYIRRGMGYESYLKKLAGGNEEKWEEWLEILDFVTSESKAYKGLADWIHAQTEYEKKLREQGKRSKEEKLKNVKGSDAKQIPTVLLMTAHASKGLEFDTVYIPDCNENVFPHGRMPEKEVCEEERRIFYVAMTRAKKNLELLYLIGTKERPRLPSRFLNPLY